MTHLNQELITDAIEVNVKPYIILHPKGKTYFRILKASINDNQLKLETIKYPQYNFHESEFDIIVMATEGLKTASEGKPSFPGKALALNSD